jgi:tRNA dimethylallyltransferase
MRERLIVILGPTATGKSALALEAALCLGGEIINSDSMQIYRGMDIGTAKPPLRARKEVRHHLFDMIDPDERYTAGRYRSDAARAIEEIRERGRLPLVVGGTGLYIRALTEGLFDGPAEDPAIREELLREAGARGKAHLHEMLREVDPASARAIHPNNTRRVIRALEVWRLTGRPISELQRESTPTEPPYDTLKIGLALERPLLYERIDRRVEEMIKEGLVDETRGLVERGYDESSPAMGGLGYKECLAHIRGRITLDEAVRLIKRNTRHYAKRQMTWFRKDAAIKWFNPSEKADIMDAIQGFAAHGQEKIHCK